MSYAEKRWGKPRDPASPANTVTPFPERGITCFKRFFVRKGALIAFCDFRINALNLVLHDCKWFEKDGREWIGLPSTSFQNREGKTIYKDLVEFDDKTARDKFQIAALDAVKAYREP